MSFHPPFVFIHEKKELKFSLLAKHKKTGKLNKEIFMFIYIVAFTHHTGKSKSIHP